MWAPQSNSQFSVMTSSQKKQDGMLGQGKAYEGFTPEQQTKPRSAADLTEDRIPKFIKDYFMKLFLEKVEEGSTEEDEDGREKGPSVRMSSMVSYIQEGPSEMSRTELQTAEAEAKEALDPRNMEANGVSQQHQDTLTGLHAQVQADTQTKTDEVALNILEKIDGLLLEHPEFAVVKPYIKAYLLENPEPMDFPEQLSLLENIDKLVRGLVAPEKGFNAEEQVALEEVFDKAKYNFKTQYQYAKSMRGDIEAQLYTSETEKKYANLRSVITPFSTDVEVLVAELITSGKLNIEQDEAGIAKDILSYVQNNYEYQQDKCDENGQCQDHWKSIAETIEHGYGDCEDLSILTTALLMNVYTKKGHRIEDVRTMVTLSAGYTMEDLGHTLVKLNLEGQEGPLALDVTTDKPPLNFNDIGFYELFEMNDNYFIKYGEISDTFTTAAVNDIKRIEDGFDEFDYDFFVQKMNFHDDQIKKKISNIMVMPKFVDGELYVPFDIQDMIAEWITDRKTDKTIKLSDYIDAYIGDGQMKDIDGNDLGAIVASGSSIKDFEQIKVFLDETLQFWLEELGSSPDGTEILNFVKVEDDTVDVNESIGQLASKFNSIDRDGNVIIDTDSFTQRAKFDVWLKDKVSTMSNSALKDVIPQLNTLLFKQLDPNSGGSEDYRFLTFNQRSVMGTIDAVQFNQLIPAPKEVYQSAGLKSEHGISENDIFEFPYYDIQINESEFNLYLNSLRDEINQFLSYAYILMSFANLVAEAGEDFALDSAGDEEAAEIRKNSTRKGNSKLLKGMIKLQDQMAQASQEISDQVFKFIQNYNQASYKKVELEIDLVFRDTFMEALFYDFLDNFTGFFTKARAQAKARLAEHKSITAATNALSQLNLTQSFLNRIKANTIDPIEQERDQERAQESSRSRMQTNEYFDGLRDAYVEKGTRSYNALTDKLIVIKQTVDTKLIGSLKRSSGDGFDGVDTTNFSYLANQLGSSQIGDSTETSGTFTGSIINRAKTHNKNHSKTYIDLDQQHLVEMHNLLTNYEVINRVFFMIMNKVMEDSIQQTRSLGGKKADPIMSSMLGATMSILAVETGRVSQFHSSFTSELNQAVSSTNEFIQNLIEATKKLEESQLKVVKTTAYISSFITFTLIATTYGPQIATAQTAAAAAKLGPQLAPLFIASNISLNTVDWTGYVMFALSKSFEIITEAAHALRMEESEKKYDQYHYQTTLLDSAYYQDQAKDIINMSEIGKIGEALNVEGDIDENSGDAQIMQAAAGIFNDYGYLKQTYNQSYAVDEATGTTTLAAKNSEHTISDETLISALLIEKGDGTVVKNNLALVHLEERLAVINEKITLLLGILTSYYETLENASEDLAGGADKAKRVDLLKVSDAILRDEEYIFQVHQGELDATMQGLSVSSQKYFDLALKKYEAHSDKPALAALAPLIPLYNFGRAAAQGNPGLTAQAAHLSADTIRKYAGANRRVFDMEFARQGANYHRMEADNIKFTEILRGGGKSEFTAQDVLIDQLRSSTLSDSVIKYGLTKGNPNAMQNFFNNLDASEDQALFDLFGDASIASSQAFLGDAVPNLKFTLDDVDPAFAQQQYQRHKDAGENLPDKEATIKLAELDDTVFINYEEDWSAFLDLFEGASRLDAGTKYSDDKSYGNLFQPKELQEQLDAAADLVQSTRDDFSENLESINDLRSDLSQADIDALDDELMGEVDNDPTRDKFFINTILLQMNTDKNGSVQDQLFGALPDGGLDANTIDGLGDVLGSNESSSASGASAADTAALEQIQDSMKLGTINEHKFTSLEAVSQSALDEAFKLDGNKKGENYTAVENLIRMSLFMPDSKENTEFQGYLNKFSPALSQKDALFKTDRFNAMLVERDSVKNTGLKKVLDDLIIHKYAHYAMYKHKTTNINAMDELKRQKADAQIMVDRFINIEDPGISQGDLSNRAVSIQNSANAKKVVIPTNAKENFDFTKYVEVNYDPFIESRQKLMFIAMKRVLLAMIHKAEWESRQKAMSDMGAKTISNAHIDGYMQAIDRQNQADTTRLDFAIAESQARVESYQQRFSSESQAAMEFLGIAIYSGLAGAILLWGLYGSTVSAARFEFVGAPLAAAIAELTKAAISFHVAEDLIDSQNDDLTTVKSSFFATEDDEDETDRADEKTGTVKIDTAIPNPKKQDNALFNSGFSAKETDTTKQNINKRDDIMKTFFTTGEDAGVSDTTKGSIRQSGDLSLGATVADSSKDVGLGMRGLTPGQKANAAMQLQRMARTFKVLMNIMETEESAKSDATAALADASASASVSGFSKLINIAAKADQDVVNKLQEQLIAKLERHNEFQLKRFEALVGVITSSISVASEAIQFKTNNSQNKNHKETVQVDAKGKETVGFAKKALKLEKLERGAALVSSIMQIAAPLIVASTMGGLATSASYGDVDAFGDEARASGGFGEDSETLGQLAGHGAAATGETEAAGSTGEGSGIENLDIRTEDLEASIEMAMISLDVTNSGQQMSKAVQKLQQHLANAIFEGFLLNMVKGAIKAKMGKEEQEKSDEEVDAGVANASTAINDQIDQNTDAGGGQSLADKKREQAAGVSTSGTPGTTPGGPSTPPVERAEPTAERPTEGAAGNQATESSSQGGSGGGEGSSGGRVAAFLSTAAAKTIVLGKAVAAKTVELGKAAVSKTVELGKAAVSKTVELGKAAAAKIGKASKEVAKATVEGAEVAAEVAEDVAEAAKKGAEVVVEGAKVVVEAAEDVAKTAAELAKETAETAVAVVDETTGEMREQQKKTTPVDAADPDKEAPILTYQKQGPEATKKLIAAINLQRDHMLKELIGDIDNDVRQSGARGTVESGTNGGGDHQRVVVLEGQIARLDQKQALIEGKVSKLDDDAQKKFSELVSLNEENSEGQLHKTNVINIQKLRLDETTMKKLAKVSGKKIMTQQGVLTSEAFGLTDEALKAHLQGVVGEDKAEALFNEINSKKMGLFKTSEGVHNQAVANENKAIFNRLKKLGLIKGEGTVSDDLKAMLHSNPDLLIHRLRGSNAATIREGFDFLMGKGLKVSKEDLKARFAGAAVQDIEKEKATITKLEKEIKVAREFEALAGKDHGVFGEHMSIDQREKSLIHLKVAHERKKAFTKSADLNSDEEGFVKRHRAFNSFLDELSVDQKDTMRIAMDKERDTLLNGNLLDKNIALSRLFGKLEKVHVDEFHGTMEKLKGSVIGATSLDTSFGKNKEGDSEVSNKDRIFRLGHAGSTLGSAAVRFTDTFGMYARNTLGKANQRFENSPKTRRIVKGLAIAGGALLSPALLGVASVRAAGGLIADVGSEVNRTGREMGNAALKSTMKNKLTPLALFAGAGGVVAGAAYGLGRGIFFETNPNKENKSPKLMTRTKEFEAKDKLKSIRKKIATSMNNKSEQNRGASAEVFVNNAVKVVGEHMATSTMSEEKKELAKSQVSTHLQNAESTKTLSKLASNEWVGGSIMDQPFNYMLRGDFVKRQMDKVDSTLAKGMVGLAAGALKGAGVVLGAVGSVVASTGALAYNLTVDVASRVLGKLGISDVANDFINSKRKHYGELDLTHNPFRKVASRTENTSGLLNPKSNALVNKEVNLSAEQNRVEDQYAVRNAAKDRDLVHAMNEATEFAKLNNEATQDHVQSPAEATLASTSDVQSSGEREEAVNPKSAMERAQADNPGLFTAADKGLFDEIDFVNEDLEKLQKSVSEEDIELYTSGVLESLETVFDYIKNEKSDRKLGFLEKLQKKQELGGVVAKALSADGGSMQTKLNGVAIKKHIKEGPLFEQRDPDLQHIKEQFVYGMQQVNMEAAQEDGEVESHFEEVDPLTGTDSTPSRGNTDRLSSLASTLSSFGSLERNTRASSGKSSNQSSSQRVDAVSASGRTPESVEAFNSDQEVTATTASNSSHQMGPSSREVGSVQVNGDNQGEEGQSTSEITQGGEPGYTAGLNDEIQEALAGNSEGSNDEAYNNFFNSPTPSRSNNLKGGSSVEPGGDIGVEASSNSSTTTTLGATQKEDVNKATQGSNYTELLRDATFLREKLQQGSSPSAAEKSSWAITNLQGSLSNISEGQTHEIQRDIAKIPTSFDGNDDVTVVQQLDTVRGIVGKIIGEQQKSDGKADNSLLQTASMLDRARVLATGSDNVNWDNTLTTKLDSPDFMNTAVADVNGLDRNGFSGKASEIKEKAPANFQAQFNETTDASQETGDQVQIGGASSSKWGRVRDNLGVGKLKPKTQAATNWDKVVDGLNSGGDDKTIEFLNEALADNTLGQKKAEGLDITKLNHFDDFFDNVKDGGEHTKLINLIGAMPNRETQEKYVSKLGLGVKDRIEMFNNINAEHGSSSSGSRSISGSSSLGGQNSDAFQVNSDIDSRANAGDGYLEIGTPDSSIAEGVNESTGLDRSSPAYRSGEEMGSALAEKFDALTFDFDKTLFQKKHTWHDLDLKKDNASLEGKDTAGFPDGDNQNYLMGVVESFASKGKPVGINSRQFESNVKGILSKEAGNSPIAKFFNGDNVPIIGREGGSNKYQKSQEKFGKDTKVLHFDDSPNEKQGFGDENFVDIAAGKADFQTKLEQKFSVQNSFDDSGTPATPGRTDTVTGFDVNNTDFLGPQRGASIMGPLADLDRALGAAPKGWSDNGSQLTDDSSNADYSSESSSSKHFYPGQDGPDFPGGPDATSTPIGSRPPVDESNVSNAPFQPSFEAAEESFKAVENQMDATRAAVEGVDVKDALEIGGRVENVGINSKDPSGDARRNQDQLLAGLKAYDNSVAAESNNAKAREYVNDANAVEDINAKYGDQAKAPSSMDNGGPATPRGSMSEESLMRGMEPVGFKTGGAEIVPDKNDFGNQSSVRAARAKRNSGVAALNNEPSPGGLGTITESDNNMTTLSTELGGAPKDPLVNSGSWLDSFPPPTAHWQP